MLKFYPKIDVTVSFFKFLFRFTGEFQCLLACDLKRRMCCYEMWDKFFGCTIDDV